MSQSANATQTLASNVQGTQLSWRQMNANSAEERRRIRANATSLLDEEWEMLDETIFPVLREQLNLYDAFENAGLTTDASMATTVSTWRVSDDLTEAEHSMDARTRSEEDIHAFSKQGVPLPLTHKDYRISQRELEASRNLGEGLDTMMARSAARKVAEAMEDLILYGIPEMSVEGPQGSMLDLPGLLNYGDRIQYTGSSWGTPTNVKDDLNAVINQLEQVNIEAGNTGYWLLHGTEQMGQFRNDYNPDASLTVRERVERYSEISQTIYVPQMPDGQAVLLKPVPEVIDIARDPDGPQNLQWESHGGMEHHFKVMSLMAPRIKSTYSGVTGIAHLTGLS